MENPNTDLQLIMKDLTAEDRQNFQKVLYALRTEHNISQDDYSDNRAFRFFRGHQKDPQKAIKAILTNIAWRSKAPYEEAIAMDLQKFDYTFQFVKMGFYGTDFHGRPLRIIRPSNFDMKLLIHKYTHEERYLYSLQNMERIINIVFPMCGQQAGRYIEGMVSIIDLKEVNITAAIKNAPYFHSFQGPSKELQDNYPEIAYKVLIINAGYLFTGLWAIIKLFLNKLTLEKITILGSNYMPELLKFTTVDRLPISIGGTCAHDINSHPNLFDQEFQSSIREKRLCFPKPNLKRW